MKKGSNYIHINPLESIMHIGNKDERIKSEIKAEANKKFNQYIEEKEEVSKKYIEDLRN